MDSAKTMSRAMDILSPGKRGKIPVQWNIPNIRNTLRQGLPYSSLEHLRGKLELEPLAITSLLETSPRTINRRKLMKKLTPAESDRLFRVARIMALAEEVFDNDSHKASSWLCKSNRTLNNEKPISLLNTDVGVKQVEELLMQIEYGMLS